MVLSLSVFRPVFGSVTPKQALCWPWMIGGSQRACCSRLPCTTTGCRPKTFMWIAEAPVMPAPEPDTVSSIRHASLMPRPAPPNSCGIAMPSQPALAMAP